MSINLLMKTILALLAIFIIASCEQQVPIPKTPYGFTIGDPDGTLHIQAFLDFQCPDSKNSFNALRSVMRSIDFVANRIKFTFQMAPLPYHFYAFKLHQAFYFVQSRKTADVTQKLYEYLFDHQDQFTEQQLSNYTLSQFLDQLAATVSSVARVDEKTLRTELDTLSQSHNATRDHWKYSIGVYGISGAPFFAANEVIIDGAEGYGYTQWIEFLQKYVS